VENSLQPTVGRSAPGKRRPSPVNIRRRLERIEKQLRQQSPDAPGRDFTAECAAIRAYLDGTGPPPPEPPCPSWEDPEEHFCRYRTGLCFLMRGHGDLTEGEFLPGMDEAERHRVDGYLRALELMTRSALERMPEGNPDHDPNAPATLTHFHA